MTSAMPEPAPLVIGLAGGIGAGKSHVASRFAALGFLVSDSDASARAQLCQEDVSALLKNRWGARILRPDGSVDRAVVASIVFDAPSERLWLESVIHPLLRAERERVKAESVRTGARGVVIDAPLLFEAGVDRECDAVVWVESSQAERHKRLMDRGWSADDIRKREAAQWPLEEKRARCAYTVFNANGQPDLDQQVRSVFEQVERLARSKVRVDARRPGP